MRHVTLVHEGQNRLTALGIEEDGDQVCDLNGPDSCLPAQLRLSSNSQFGSHLAPLASIPPQTRGSWGDRLTVMEPFAGAFARFCREARHIENCCPSLLQLDFEPQRSYTRTAATCCPIVAGSGSSLALDSALSKPDCPWRITP